MNHDKPATPDSYGLPEIDATLQDNEPGLAAMSAAVQVGDVGTLARMLYPEYYRPRVKPLPLVARRKIDDSDRATILAALRAFQKHYEDQDAFAVYRDWLEHFTRFDGSIISPLGSDDIDRLCEEINCGLVTL